MLEEVELSTQPAGQLAEPPRWPPTAIGTDDLPEPGDDGRPERYRMPLLRRVSLMMLAVLLAVGSISVAAAPLHAGPLGVAARTFVGGTLGAASLTTYRRALLPPSAVQVLREAREARWRRQERLHRARAPSSSVRNAPIWLQHLIRRVGRRAMVATARSRRRVS